MVASLEGGLKSGQTIRLRGAGHFQVNSGYDNLFLNIEVESKTNMTIAGINVISKLEISLLEALEGTEKEVDTIKGKNKLVVPKLSKNEDKVSFSGYGVIKSEMIGDHIFTLNVKYPENVEDLINCLKRK